MNPKLKDFLGKSISALSPKLFFGLLYTYHRKRLPNFKHPSDLSEFAIKRILDGEIDKIYWLADKYEVRKFVSDKGFADILTPLIGVYEDADEIDLSKLPERFALKANYGAGMNLICTDKSRIDEHQLKKTVRGWLESSHKYSMSERHYNLIAHKVVCEEFIDDGSGGFPTDYKFLCIKGKARCVLACNGRETEHAHYAHYDMDWNFKPEYDRKHRAAGVIPKPANFEEMVSIAEKLSEGIDLVRVDLFSNGSRIWFGEMTLTPAAGLFKGWSDEAIAHFGKYLKKS